jgi:PrtD family type I secretion system ABC transporter
MKLLGDEMRPLLRDLAAFSFFINLIYIVPSLFTLQIFDRVLPSNSQETLTVLLGGTLIALLILLLLDYVRNRLQNLLGNILEERLSPMVVHAIVEKAARAPHHASREALSDVATLRNLLSSTGVNALFDAPWAPVYVLVIWTFHPELGMAASAAIVMMLSLAWLNNYHTQRVLQNLQTDGRRVSQYVSASLRNAEVLQALGMTGKLLLRWRGLQSRLLALQTEASRHSSAFSSATRFMRQAIQVIVLSFGAYLVITQRASAGVMIATTFLLNRAVQPVEQLVANWRLLADSRSAYRRLLALSLDSNVPASQVILPRPEGALVVQGVSYRAPDSEKPILLNISFALASGEALAIIGPSGMGKSTLARLLTGVWAPNSGVVRLDDADVAYWAREEAGQWMGYVPQDVELFDGTVAENIARLGDVDSALVVGAAKRAYAHELILALSQGYETQVGEQGAKLSPGQRQRIALARALYGDPRLVVLDEPNANLDGAGELALTKAIKSLRNDGVTTVVITHRPALIAHVDKILVIDAGRVKEFGPTGDVLRSLQRQAQPAQAEPAEHAA